MRRNATLSGAQLIAVRALTVGANVTCTAKIAGVARQTVSRWIHQDDKFQAEMRRVYMRAMGLLRARVAGHTMKALEKLDKILDSNHIPYRLAAARQVLALSPLARNEPIGLWPEQFALEDFEEEEEEEEEQEEEQE